VFKGFGFDVKGSGYKRLTVVNIWGDVSCRVAEQVGKAVDRQVWSFPNSNRVNPMLGLVDFAIK
jgi:hypothetical protein